MKSSLAAAAIAAALVLTTGEVASAQTTTSTKVSTDTDTSNGVATQKTKVVHVRKHKTRRPKKILGVKVGHKTMTQKSVRETSTSTNGDHSTTVKTSN